MALTTCTEMCKNTCCNKALLSFHGCKALYYKHKVEMIAFLGTAQQHFAQSTVLI